jgi:TolB-like protein/Tfp pilus assembly protein PilF
LPAALGLLAAGALVWLASRNLTRPTPSVAEASIAVLPFTDLSPARDQEFFADGVAEELLNALTQLEGLHVAGRTSSFSFKGKNLKASEIARELNVNHLLEGSVRREGKRVRITAQLIDARDGYDVWSQAWDRQLDDVLVVQDEIAQAVLRALTPKLLPARAPAPSAHGSQNVEAYSEYLLARRFMNEGDDESYRRAGEALERALQHDPGYAAAWALLGEALMEHAKYASDAAEISALQQRARAAADKAIALAPEQPDGFVSRAMILAEFFWDFAGARADLARSLQLSPGNAVALRERAWVLFDSGHPDAAIPEFERAATLDPLDRVTWHGLGVAQLCARQLPGARVSLERALHVAPHAPGSAFMLGEVDRLEGHPDQALTRFDAIEDPMWRLAGRSMALAGLGRREESRAALSELERRYGNSAAFSIAGAHATLGDADGAFRWLDQAFERRERGLSYLQSFPWFDRLRSDPRYLSLLRRMGLAAPER